MGFCILDFKYKNRVRIFTKDIVSCIKYFNCFPGPKNKEMVLLLCRFLDEMDKLDDSPLKYKENLGGIIKAIAQLIENNFVVFSSINPYVVLTLMRVCYINGYIYLAYRLRVEAVKLFCSISTNGNSLLSLEKLKALAENGEDFSKVDIELIDKKHWHAIKNIGLYLNKRDELIEAKLYSESDHQFRDYLEGKSIAIVGPVSLGQLNGKEIDQFDVVLRFNYFGLEGYNENEFGTKTNISCYIEENIKKRNKEIAKLALQLDFLIHQETSPKQFDSFKKITTPSRSMLAIWGERSNPYLLANPNAVQKALFDILRFRTGRIKVFNSNLFIDKTINPAYRSDSFKVSNFIWHDVFSQFVFTKRMYDLGIIEADHVLENVLKMTLDEYAFEMDKTYGTPLVQ